MTPSSKASTKPWQASPSSLSRGAKKTAPERRFSGAELLYGAECRYFPVSTRSWVPDPQFIVWADFWVAGCCDAHWLTTTSGVKASEPVSCCLRLPSEGSEPVSCCCLRLPSEGSEPVSCCCLRLPSEGSEPVNCCCLRLPSEDSEPLGHCCLQLLS